MIEVSIIGIDLAKRVFQVHGAAADGSVVFRRKLSRQKLLGLLSQQPRCRVAMEACATAHYWGREIIKLGHEVKLIAAIYVKAFVKRQKNDAADSEAIAEAASRPTMRFVMVRTEDQQANSMLFRTRDLLVGQRTQLVNALRGHLAEYGVIAAKGIIHVGQLAGAVEDSASGLPSLVREMGRLYLEQIANHEAKIKALEQQLRSRAREDEATVRLMTMPGIGPITAMAIQAFAPPPENFRSGRDFAAWTGLVPRQKSTGGKQILGKTSKMGQRDIRRLLIIGAMAVIRWAARKKLQKGTWLARMMARRPPMVVATALANKMARAVWGHGDEKGELQKFGGDGLSYDLAAGSLAM